MSPLPLVFQISHLRPPHSQPLLRQCVHIYLGEMILGGEWWGRDLSSFSCNYSQLMCPPLSFTLKFQPAPPSPTPNRYSIETVQTYFTQMNGGVGGGESFLPFYHDAMGGYQVTYHICCSNFHKIVKLFSIPVKMIVFLCVVCEECTVYCFCRVGRRSVIFSVVCVKMMVLFTFYDIHFLGIE